MFYDIIVGRYSIYTQVDTSLLPMLALRYRPVEVKTCQGRHRFDALRGLRRHGTAIHLHRAPEHVD